MSYNSMYSTTLDEMTSRMSGLATALAIAMTITTIIKGEPLMVMYETPGDVVAREAAELAAQKLAAINSHVQACSERRGLKPGNARWCRSYDRSALAIQADPGRYNVTVRNSRWRSSTYELYIGDPKGAVLRRLS